MSDNEMINSGCEVVPLAYFALIVYLAVYVPSWIRFVVRKVKKLKGDK